ncbi:MauE/DoxX family redox-associated membrane protein [Melioribacteraceae bacterium 4301-Me]|uniref:MauE/DoxX family redox-associated membrane protein n=1 Tax=Pyranulibacter aquaticus TaxID=3163344 RepID=UPI00359AE9B7
MSTIEYTINNEKSPLRGKLKNSQKFFFKAVYYLITVILLFSGVSKIIDINPLIETLKEVKLPHDLIITIATLLPITEIGLGIMLLLKIKQRTSIKITVILFLVFFLFSVYGMVMGIEKDCGCFGNAIKSEFGWGMVGRNTFLLLLSIVVLERENRNALALGEIKQ